MWPRLVVCFALGAVLGTMLDGIHVYRDVLSYETPAFGRWAWFVPVEFGLLGAGVGFLVPLIEGRITGGRSNWSAGRRLGELLLFFALYAASAVADGRAAAALAMVLLLLAIVRLALGPTAGDLPYVAAAAVLGPAVEAVIAGAGAFSYSHPDFIGIPYWLPGLWANAGFLVRRLVAPIVMPAATRTAALPLARTAVDRS
jgi:hypothetical protein